MVPDRGRRVGSHVSRGPDSVDNCPKTAYSGVVSTWVTGGVDAVGAPCTPIGRSRPTLGRVAPPTAVPEIFAQAVTDLRSVTPRPEIELEEIKAPQRLAPYAYALSATVIREGEDIATGRLILLHDPAEPDAWGATLRLVTYIAAELDAEMATDPFLPEVGWSWLIDALNQNGARFTAAAGTVTQTISHRFGDLAGTPSEADIEIRASWSPLDRSLRSHLDAWCALLASTVGLPPPGVAVLPRVSGRLGLA